MIRSFNQSDLDSVMAIWLNSNIAAHPFVPREYWEANEPMVREMIPQSDVFVAEEAGMVRGFIGIADGYIAGIFVDGNYRSHGLGRQLLNRAKEQYDALTLHVYQENRRAVAFYQREGFQISEAGTDEGTGRADYAMSWKR